MDASTLEVQDFKKITHGFRGVYGLDLNLINKEPKDHNM